MISMIDLDQARERREALSVAGPATLTPGQRPTHPEVPYDHRRP